MWVKPAEVLLAHALWVTRKSNQYFHLQERRGHGSSKGLFSKVVGECAPPLRPVGGNATQGWPVRQASSGS